jgi:tyrosyl-tRNA synthetase
VWLDPQRTSPSQFFQVWMGADDSDVGRLLRQFTFLPGEETDAVISEHLAAPEKRNAQRRLAREVTGLVHGADQTEAVEAAARIVFGEDPRDATTAVLEALAAELPSAVVPALPGDLSRLLVDIGIAGSLSDARRGLQQRAFAVNGTKVTPEQTISSSDLLRGRFLVVSKGRKTHHVVEIADRS